VCWDVADELVRLIELIDSNILMIDKNNNDSVILFFRGTVITFASVIRVLMKLLLPNR
jgi:hypothetical protein